ncbi:hypothetical protein RirG_227280 [Rhizophagus irregularis DAOM 197198w]|uniref:Uncharacterized protein n=2 Tax=Rhizophagus irregularis TaxID=588596 RepID=A0A015IM05_RHIIW|nr:hypothetical protein RirG_227280 [Rhizophagus irregularis DAOM 197198w]
MRHPQLPLYIQHPSPKERPQVKKKNEIYVSEPDKIPFLASGTNSPVLIIIGSSRSHPTTINVSWKSNQEKIIAVAFGVASSALILERKKELASIGKGTTNICFLRNKMEM